MKIQTRLISVFVPLVIVPVIAIGWFWFQQLREDGRDAAFLQAHDALYHLRQSIELISQKADDNTRLIAGEATIQRYALARDETKKAGLQGELLRLFQRYAYVHRDFISIRYVTPDGQEQVKITKGGDSELGVDAFVSAMTQPIHEMHTGVYIDPDSQEMALHTLHPITPASRVNNHAGAGKTVRGYVATSTSLREVQSHIEHADKDASENLALFSNDGALVFGQNKLPLHLLPHLRTWALDFDNNHSAAWHEDTAYGESYYNHGETAGAGFRVLATIPQKSVNNPFGVMGFQVFVITIVAVAGVLLMIVWLYRTSLGNPLRQLQGTMNRIGEGDFTPEINSALDPNVDEEFRQLASSLQDMGENLLHSREQIKFLAYHDHLTRLPNRLSVREHLQTKLTNVSGDRVSLVLISLDIDNFKHVNDTLGHEFGDKVLVQLAQRLRQWLRVQTDLSATISRLGGDEFLLLVNQIENPAKAGRIAKEVLTAIHQPVSVDGIEHRLSASAGITCFPKDGGDADTLIKNADLAMYDAKDSGKNTFRFYSDKLNAMALQRLNVENRLRDAVRRREFSLKYQPQVDINSGRIASAEALIRWCDRAGVNHSPAEFIPLAEQSRLINEIGRWTFDEACRQVRTWHDNGYHLGRTYVNVSPAQLANYEVLAQIKAALKESGIEPQGLGIEITETALMQNPARSADLLNSIAKLGVKIAIDDFGTGYSSLNYIHRFPISSLKIDRSFIENIVDDDASVAIVGTMVSLADRLGLTVVAEGVENRQQYAKLRECGVHLAQGFVISEPMSGNEMLACRIALG